jgi:hypothetical protein
VELAGKAAASEHGCGLLCTDPNRGMPLLPEHEHGRDLSPDHQTERVIPVTRWFPHLISFSIFLFGFNNLQ